ncbi:lupus La protein isoform X2 [Rhinatrema bivittatum]|nr:lupus La protein isoform X2 [Rhinatrema bivittatum]XP_029461569.1 lupus La protein isoform X2 [Rhinatrema bivittatum]XP_029461570.1 lupus La protein isoform X2 [Rhinatrema bivittatum]
MAENGDKAQTIDLEKKICQQIEYYFGDHNLPRDKFLKEQIKLDDGWVPLETMIKFNRLSRLTTDFGVIVEALGKSKTGLLEINDGKTKIRRSPDKPLPEVTDQYKTAVKNRSVYVKGFSTDSTFDEIKEWFENKGPIENIQLRRNVQKAFKGSVFVVFDSNESAKKFIAIPNQKYKDTDLVILSKEDYYAKKNEERKQLRGEKKAKCKQEKEENQKKADAEMKSLEEKTGCLLKFFGDLEDQTSREDIHAVFANHGEIKWIDFIRGAKEGIILFKEKALDALEKAKAKNNGNLQLRNKDVTWQLLEGATEKEALKKIVEDQQESFNKWKGKGRKFKGKGRGGKAGQGASDKKKIQFQGKKIKFESDEEDDKGLISPKKELDTTKEPAIKEETCKNGQEAGSSPKKRSLEEADGAEEPVAKQIKTEEGAGDQ